MAKDDLVYVQTREGQGYKMTKADAERYIKRNSSAKIVDPNAPTVATTDEGSDEGQTKKSGKDKK